MSGVKIRTNNKWREFMYFYELTNKEKKNLDWIKDDTESVLRYCGHVYALSEFMRIGNNSSLQEWDGYISDSYFSGVVIKISGDADQYKIGTFIS